MTNDLELYHHGIKGMKWGVRRYQNTDGSLTPAGKKRYDTEMDTNLKRKKDKRLPDEAIKDTRRWVREDRERTRGLVDSSKRMTEDIQTLNRSTTRVQNRRTKKMDLSNMSDKELRDHINRAMLEQQYDDMFNPKKVRSGREHVNDSLAVAGAVLGVTSSAITIALGIQQLKGGA